MSAILINKSRTACFSGHRILDKLFNLRAVEEIIDKLIQKGFDTFFSRFYNTAFNNCFFI